MSSSSSSSLYSSVVYIYTCLVFWFCFAYSSSLCYKILKLVTKIASDPLYFLYFYDATTTTTTTPRDGFNKIICRNMYMAIDIIAFRQTRRELWVLFPPLINRSDWARIDHIILIMYASSYRLNQFLPYQHEYMVTSPHARWSAKRPLFAKNSNFPHSTCATDNGLATTRSRLRI